MCGAERGVADIGWPGLLARVDLISRRTAAASERARRVAARSDPSHDFAATAFTVERLMLLARSSTRAGTAPSHGKQNPLSDPGAPPGRNLAPRLLTHQIGDPPQGHHTIATVPFTLRNLKEDLEDVGSRFDGAPDLEFRLATEALELEQSGL